MSNISASLFTLEYQSTVIMPELSVINVVLPPNEPVTNNWYFISKALQLNNVENTVKTGIA